jgi:hypothetical protein
MSSEAFTLRWGILGNPPSLRPPILLYPSLAKQILTRNSNGRHSQNFHKRPPHRPKNTRHHQHPPPTCRSRIFLLIVPRLHLPQRRRRPRLSKSLRLLLRPCIRPQHRHHIRCNATQPPLYAHQTRPRSGQTCTSREADYGQCGAV